MKTTCSSSVCCLGWMPLQSRLNNTLCRTEVSSPSSSCTLSHTRHTVLSGVCGTLCFSSLIGFQECIWSLGEIRDVLYNLTDLPPSYSHIANASHFQHPCNQLFFFASVTPGRDVDQLWTYLEHSIYIHTYIHTGCLFVMLC